MEHIDILDKAGNKTGDNATNDEAHKKGLIHKVVHIWIINSKGEILLQKRNKLKKAYPLHWDMSAAGHIDSGETSLEAAKRETFEELGLSLKNSSFNLLITLQENTVLNQGVYVNNEFQDVYVVHLDMDISLLRIGLNEVEEVKWTNIVDFKKMTEGKGELLFPHTEEHKIVLDYLKNITVPVSREGSK